MPQLVHICMCPPRIHLCDDKNETNNDNKPQAAAIATATNLNGNGTIIILDHLAACNTHTKKQQQHRAHTHKDKYHNRSLQCKKNWKKK